MAPKKLLIAPSILSCDFARLKEEIHAVESAGADWLHVDVMDGHFVDNLTIGPPVISKIKAVTEIPLDVHLMIEKPEKSLDAYIQAGSDLITIHVESTQEVQKTLEKIKGAGKKAGITLRPVTSLDKIKPFLGMVDLVLVMTVNPGFGGQSFMEDQLEKVTWLKSWADKNNPNLHIEVDGGVNPKTGARCYSAGANVFVAGNSIFKTADYRLAISELRGGK